MNNQTVSNSIGNTQTQTSTATAQSVADVVARYCISSNEDVVKDFVAVSNFLKKNETVLSSGDLVKLKLEIAHNYLQKVLERNLPLVEVAKVANLNNINRAKELLNELVNSTNEEVVEDLWKQFNVLLNGCELVEMVNLLYRKKVALSRLEKRKRIIPKLLQKYGTTQQQEVQTNEQCEDVCKQWTDILNYRMDVHRSTGKWCRTQYSKLAEFFKAFDEEAYKEIE